jgi:hypothetical protein
MFDKLGISPEAPEGIQDPSLSTAFSIANNQASNQYHSFLVWTKNGADGRKWETLTQRFQMIGFENGVEEEQVHHRNLWTTSSYSNRLLSFDYIPCGRLCRQHW